MLNKMFSTVKKRVNRITGNVIINADHISIGKGVKFGRNVVINSKSFVVGDGCVIHDNVKINATNFKLGDYGTIHHDCFFPGPGSLTIGHNFWLGNNSIVDAQGDTQIGNNVGVGAHSQLWGHMVFGDVMAGCKYDVVNQLKIGDDVWLVGHNLVSPVTIGDRSMSMLGSLVTKDMLADHTYAGSPAKDLTEKIGSQFKETSVNERREYFEKRLGDFAAKNKLNVWDFVEVLDSEQEETNEGKTSFFLQERTYLKKGTNPEMKLLRFLLPRVKFTPK